MMDVFDPSTEFQLVRSDTPRTVDGHKPGEPTGQVKCEACGATALNIDEIPHAADCLQREAHTRWWRRRHREDQ